VLICQTLRGLIRSQETPDSTRKVFLFYVKTPKSRGNVVLKRLNLCVDLPNPSGLIRSQRHPDSLRKVFVLLNTPNNVGYPDSIFFLFKNTPDNVGKENPNSQALFTKKRMNNNRALVLNRLSKNSKSSLILKSLMLISNIFFLCDLV